MTSSDSELAIRFDNVTKSFIEGEEPIKVLKGVSGEIPIGSVLTLLGPSGSGKSTLLSLCNLMATPDQGLIFVQGKEIRDWNTQELRRTVGMVFQTPTMLPGTVLDNLKTAARLHNETLEDPEFYLKKVGLSSDYLSREAEGLSGGQKQRVALARTLVTRPAVLLLDEVTSALEPATVREIEELILQIQQADNATVLWVTHDISQAKRVGNLAWLLIDGKLVEANKTSSFFEHPQAEMTQRFLRGELTGGQYR